VGVLVGRCETAFSRTTPTRRRRASRTFDGVSGSPERPILMEAQPEVTHAEEYSML